MTRSSSRFVPAFGPIALALALALGGVGVATAGATAQDIEYRISQRATISQKLGQTLVSLDYSRPLVRGRDSLFGTVVHWGEMWTPGANEATVLETDRPLTLNGHEVAPGRWSMWIIPSRVGPWELVLDPRDSLFHTQRPELTDDQIRLPIEDRWGGPETDALTWSFPRIAQDGATLRLNWSTLEIDLDVGVESIEPDYTVTAEEASPYVGQWQATFSGPPSGEAPPPAPLTVTRNEDGTLEPVFPPETFTPPSGDDEDVDPSTLSPRERERAEARRALAEPDTEGRFRVVLIPRARGVFLMGWLEGDVLLDVEKVYFEFDFEGDRAVRLEARDGVRDRVMFTAVRVDG